MKPNIIMIVVDALRPKDLSLYGAGKKVDTCLRKIASESVVFNNNFSTSNASDPSLTSIFSGQYPTTTRFIHQHPYTKKEEIDKLRKNKFWFPIFLQKRGYNTISITPQHMWFKKGFDDLMAREEEISKYRKFLHNEKILKILLRLPDSVYRFGKRIFRRRYIPDYSRPKKIIDLTIGKIKQVKKPFFIFIHFIDTHFPYPAVKTPKIKGKTTLSKILKKIKSKSQREYVKKRFYDASADNLEQLEKKRYDSIEKVDKQIGRLYSFLKKERLWKNTIFIIFADHGDSFCEHGIYFTHAGLYDESIHVPLIMYLPKIKAKRISGLTQNIDIVPTILEFLKQKKIKMDGKSLIRLINGRRRFRDKIFAFDGLGEDIKAIRTKNRKLIIAKNPRCYICKAEHHEKIEEYDLRKDPEELKNIYDEKRGLERES